MARKSEVSLTAPGEVAATASTDPTVQQILAQRRSLEQRRGEVIADAAVTLEAFVQQARRVRPPRLIRPDRN